MDCTIVRYPGAYERRTIAQALHYRGELVVVEGVPADVCSSRGDVLLASETGRQLENIFAGRPRTTAPVYAYDQLGRGGAE